MLRWPKEHPKNQIHHNFDVKSLFKLIGLIKVQAFLCLILYWYQNKICNWLKYFTDLIKTMRGKFNEIWNIKYWWHLLGCQIDACYKLIWGCRWHVRQFVITDYYEGIDCRWAVWSPYHKKLNCQIIRILQKK